MYVEMYVNDNLILNSFKQRIDCKTLLMSKQNQSTKHANKKEEEEKVEQHESSGKTARHLDRTSELRDKVHSSCRLHHHFQAASSAFYRNEGEHEFGCAHQRSGRSHDKRRHSRLPVRSAEGEEPRRCGERHQTLEALRSQRGPARCGQELADIARVANSLRQHTAAFQLAGRTSDTSLPPTHVLIRSERRIRECAAEIRIHSRLDKVFGFLRRTLRLKTS